MDIAAINYNEENDISDPESCEYPTECEEGEQLIMIDIIIGSWASEITWEIQIV
jgi:hypothetical protein